MTATYNRASASGNRLEATRRLEDHTAIAGRRTSWQLGPFFELQKFGPPLQRQRAPVSQSWAGRGMRRHQIEVSSPNRVPLQPGPAKDAARDR